MADVRVHRETKRRPIDLHAEELPYLIPLPEKPYDTAEVVYRTVNAEGMVAYRQNFYSVPWRYLGQVLPLRITEEELIVYGPGPGGARPASAVAADTSRASGASCPSTGPRKTRSSGKPILRERFAELGPAASRFLEGLLKTHRMGKDQAQRVLALLETYRKRDLTAALERAARFGAFSLRAVERILAAQAQPKTPLESLGDQQQQHLREILDDRPVPPRPTADYEQLYLYPQEPPDDDPPPETPTRPTPAMICGNASSNTSRRCGSPCRQTNSTPRWPRRRSSGGARWNSFRTCSVPRPISAASGPSNAGFARPAFANRCRWRASTGTSTPRPSTACRSRPWPPASSFAAETTSSSRAKAAWERAESCNRWEEPPVRLGYRVRYTTSAELLQDLTASLADHSLPQRLRYYSNFDFLIIDEFGFDKIERAESARRPASCTRWSIAAARRSPPPW